MNNESSDRKIVGDERMGSIHDQLRVRYPAPEWAIFFEVANGLGLADRRYADAVAMSLFPSRGLDVHGFEVKTARGDWLRELKNPTKADVIASYCDFWWLVAGDEKVAQKDEVPRAWGLLVSKDGELRQVKKPERLKPKAIDRAFMGAMFRRADEWATAQLKNDARVVAAREEGRKEGEETRDWRNSEAVDDLKKLKDRLAEFEKVSGITIDKYSYGNIGEAVRKFMHSQKEDVVEDLERVAGWIEGSAKDLRERVELIKKGRAARTQEPAESTTQ